MSNDYILDAVSMCIMHVSVCIQTDKNMCNDRQARFLMRSCCSANYLIFGNNNNALKILK